MGSVPEYYKPSGGEPFEPVAIIGMAMRLPGGVRSADDFWDLLVDKRSGLCDVPADRFSIEGFHHPSGRAGSVPQRQAYYLSDLDVRQFDPSAFSMGKKELERLDPAQRQLLQVAYECLEDAGVSAWRGSRTGCFVGTYGEDWLDVHAKEPQHRGGYRGTSWGDFALSNRVSYELDLRGPSMTVKTACSSSLVCLDLACAAIRAGECEDGALVGGTSLMLSPTAWMTLHDQGLLSPTGACRTFDAGANGYARGEAVNMLYLKRLRTALADGDPIRAVIRGAAVNSDGRTPGLTLPSATAQAALIRQTYAAAGLGRPEQMAQTAMVECHGTGTPVGDPIEARAVASCFGAQGVVITGVKPNVGHAEGAAGVTSMIKAVLALEHGMVPPNIHFDVPNPKIPFAASKLHVPTTVESWPAGRAERVSVNSFGVGGVNAHVILESAQEFFRSEAAKDLQAQAWQDVATDDVATRDTDSPSLLLFSAYDPDALSRQVDGLVAYAAGHPETRLDDVAYTLANRRERRPYRAYAVASSLHEAAAVELSPAVETNASQPPRVIWIFTGQGAQWPEMAASLMADNAVFRATIQRLDRHVQSLPQAPDWRLEDQLAQSANVHAAQFGHPLTVALQLGLVDVLRSWGLQPDLVVGHSSGEMAAAYASGGITAEEAIAAAVFRGQEQTTAADMPAASTAPETPTIQGAMAAVGLGRDDVAPFLRPGIVVACDNSQLSVTLAGDAAALDETLAALETGRPGTFARKLRVARAFHSHHMRPYGAAYEAQLRPLVQSVQPRVPMYSSTTGARISGDGALDAAYWRRNMESPVLFNGALRAALQHDGSAAKTLLLEVGPHSALAGPVGQILRDMGRTSDVHVATLVRGKSTRASLLHCAGRLFQHGALSAHGSAAVCPGGHFLNALPRYPWAQDTSHWMEPRLAHDWRFRRHPAHELLGSRVLESTATAPSWRKVLALEDAAWLEGHDVGGQVVLPAAGFVAMVGEALRQLSDPENATAAASAAYSVRNMSISAARVLEAGAPVELVTALSPDPVDDDSPWYTFTISSISAAGGDWVRHCYGEARLLADKSVSMAASSAPLPALPRHVDAASWYGVLERIGLRYTGPFYGLTGLSAATTRDAAVGTVPQTSFPPQDSYPYALHPAAIDRCFQVMITAAARGLRKNMRQLVVPTFIGELVVTPCDEDLQVSAQLRAADGRRRGGAFAGDIAAYSTGGARAQVLHVADMRTTPLTGGDTAEDEAASALPIVSQLQWLPHADFVDLADYMHPVAATPAAVWHQLEELTLLCALDHLETLTVEPGVTPAHLGQFVAWMDALVQRYRAGDNQFVRAAAALETLSPAQRHARIAQIADAVDASPFRPFSTAMRRLFAAAPAIFAGTTHPLHVLLEDDVLTAFYNAGDVLDYGEAIRLLGNTTPRLRVLEVGAGTGGTSAKIFQALQADADLGGERLYGSYRYTDVSSGFMPAAKKRFAHVAGIEYAVLDVSKDPLAQGFAPGSFDLIVGANVIHATPSLRVTLGHLHSLLSPGGRLFLSELCPETMFINYVMGFLSGWWLGAEDNRANEPWIAPARWAVELAAAGFQPPDAVVLDYAKPYHTAAGILVSREARTTRPTRVVLLCRQPDGPYAGHVRQTLAVQGVPVTTAALGADLPADADVLSLLDVEDDAADPVVYGLTEQTLGQLVGTLQAVAAASGTRMVWATRPAQVGCTDPRAGMLLGLARTARNDLSVPLFTVEVDGTTPVATASARLVQILERVRTPAVNMAGMDPDYEFAVVGETGEVLVPRLHWQTLAAAEAVTAREAARETATETKTRAYLDVRTPGLLHTMGWKQGAVRAPGPGEVLIQPKAAGLNFRDVMIALGVLQYDPSEMGFEGSGVVQAVGAGVCHLAAGDRVLYLGSGCFTTALTLSAGLCVRMDDSMTFEQAAALPGVSTTALLALVDKAQLACGQSVLIHAACGGVGLAAIQIARQIGAEIYCTVGTPEKVEYLVEHCGIDRSRIFHSRDASFLPAVLQATGGRGVDVVLNSLSGDLLRASWQCVAEFGTMVEIGKRDFERRAQLPMAPFEHNRTFVGLELRLLSLHQQATVARLMQRCVDMVCRGKQEQAGAGFSGPPIDSVFPIDRIRDAFRHMQTAQHIGKIVLTLPADPAALLGASTAASVPAALRAPLAFRADRSYLLAGGLGGLGRSIATWMVEHGARHLVFLARSAGLPANDLFAAELRSQGCHVQLVAGSVTEAGDVRRAVATAAATGRPVAGVLNLSMVLRDADLARMGFADWTAAVAPKVQGTWNLHDATVGSGSGSGGALDFFVLFASYAGFGGHSGQANYAAGNTFLDAFVQYRHGRGLAASVVDVGVMADVGFVARDARLLARLARTVMRPVREQELLATLALCIQRSRPAGPAVTRGASLSSLSSSSGYTNPSQILLGLVTTIPIASPQNRAAWRHDARMSLYYNHGTAAADGADGDGAAAADGGSTVSLKAQLAAVPEADKEQQTATRAGLLATALAATLANFLIRDVASIPLDRSLESIGVDSLVAVEVRNWIRQQAGVETTTVTIVQSPSLEQLARHIAKSMA